jgi:hypothetical protein
VLQGDDEIGKRSAPAIKPPDENRFDFAAADGGEQFLTLRLLQGTGTYLLDLLR